MASTADRPPSTRLPSVVLPEGRIRTLFEHAPVGVAVIAPDSQILVANSRLSEILQRPLGELQQMRMRDLMPPGDVDEIQHNRAAMLRGELDSLSSRRHLHLPDGEHRWVATETQIIRDATGEAAYFLTIVYDIDDRVAFEAAQAGLRQALEADRFVIHFQPFVELATGRCVAAEALLRWNEGDGVFTPAADFIVEASRTGMLVELSDAAMRQAAAQAVAWRCGTDDALVDYVTVNLSPRQLAREGFTASVLDLVDGYGVPRAGIRLELTEETLSMDLDRAGDLLAILDEAGIVVGIDDFGTGHASLAHLDRLPVRFMKLDGAMIATLGTDRESPLVPGVVRLARDLDLEVVAERVETAAQVRRLRELGVDLAQGDFFSPALAPERFEEWLAETEEA